MFAPPAVVSYVPAPSSGDVSLIAAFARARAAARGAADPAAVLDDDAASADAKLDALDALQDRIPGQTRAGQAASLDALAAAAQGANQPPAVRAKAYMLLGYAVPPVVDETARGRAVRALLAGLSDPAYRLFVLRGLGPAAHGLPPALEPDYEGALLGLLDGPVSGEERETALLDLNGFVSGGDESPKLEPDVFLQLDARLLAPIEADPGAFVRDARWTPAARELAAAVLWISARRRQADGEPAPAARVKALLNALIAVDPDASARAWYASYRDAAPADPGLTASATKRSPDGRGEP